MPGHRRQRYCGHAKTIELATTILITIILAVFTTLALSACGEGQTITSSPQVSNGESNNRKLEDGERSSTPEQPKTMTKADQAARDSLIIDAEARGFTYVSDQTEYHPNLDTSDTGGLSTNAFAFTVKVGTCQPDGTIRYIKTKGATKFVVDDWSAKLTIGDKTVGNTFATMDRLKKRALIWKYSDPELYQCIVGKQ